MNTIVIPKGASIVELPRVVEHGLFTKNTKRTFKGKEFDIKAMRDTLELDGYVTQLTQGPNWTLDVNVAADINTFGQLDTSTAPRRQWEYTINNSTKDILESNSPIVVGGIGPDGERYVTLDPIHLNALKDWLKNGHTDALPAFDYFLGTGYVNNYEADANETARFNAQYNQALSLYYLMAAGTRTVDVKLPVIRTTSQLQPGFDDIESLINSDGRVISTNTIQSTGDIPAWLIIILNGDLFNPDAIAVDSGASTETPRNYGWLEKVNNSSETTEGRINLVIEYHWGLWSEILYGAPI